LNSYLLLTKTDGEPENDGLRAVSVVDRALMHRFLDRATALGISPDIVVPDHLLLLPPDDGVLAVGLGDIVSVRGERIAFSAETELASICFRGLKRSSPPARGRGRGAPPSHNPTPAGYDSGLDELRRIASHTDEFLLEREGIVLDRGPASGAAIDRPAG